MFDNHFSLSDIRIEVIETADNYMKAVLINTKKRYFRILRKLVCKRQEKTRPVLEKN